MAFTAGNTLSTGHIVTASDWNNYLGSSGSIDYLKTEVDKIDDITIDVSSISTDVLCQNTTDSIRFITIWVRNQSNEKIKLLTGSTSSTGTTIGNLSTPSTGGYIDSCISGCILPNYYYTVSTQSGAPLIMHWTEWDIH